MMILYFMQTKITAPYFITKDQAFCLLPLNHILSPGILLTNSLASGKIILNKRWNDKEQKKSLQNQDWHYFAIIMQESYFIFFKSPFYPWRLFSVFGIINSAKKSFPPEGMKYLKNRQSWIWPYHLGEWWKQKQ